MSVRSALTCLLLTCLLAPRAAAQGMPEQFSTGTDAFPVEVYLRFVDQAAAGVAIFPGEGVSGIELPRPPGRRARLARPVSGTGIQRDVRGLAGHRQRHGLHQP